MKETYYEKEEGKYKVEIVDVRDGEVDLNIIAPESINAIYQIRGEKKEQECEPIEFFVMLNIERWIKELKQYMNI